MIKNSAVAFWLDRCTSFVALCLPCDDHSMARGGAIAEKANLISSLARVAEDALKKTLFRELGSMRQVVNDICQAKGKR